jgi:tetratricopeptide (TPR) repeat protein
VAVIDEVLEPAARLDLVDIIADALITRGSALAEIGRDHEGVSIIEAGLRLAEANGIQRAVERGRNNVGSFQLVRDPTAAIATYRAAIEDARRLGTLGGGLRLVFGSADAALAIGEWDEAEASIEAVLASDPDRENRAAALGKAILIRALRGQDLDPVMEEFDRLAGDTQDSLLAMAVGSVHGTVAWAAGRLPAARARLRDAARRNAQYAPLHLAMAARIGVWMGDADGAEADVASLDAQLAHGPAIELRRLACVSGIAALRGRSSEALSGFREAMHLGRDHGLAWEEALAGLDAVLLLEPSDAEVRSIADRTREILVRLGALPFLGLLEQRLGSRARATEEGAGEKAVAAGGVSAAAGGDQGEPG